MKKILYKKKIIIFLILIGILAILGGSGILVHKVMAESKPVCSVCGLSEYMQKVSESEASCTWKCTSGQHVSYEPTKTIDHTCEQCIYCDNKSTTHSYNTNGWSTTSTTHARRYKCSICGVGYTESSSQHTMTLKDNGDGTHSGTCTVCNKTVTEEHNHSTYTDNGDGTHSSECTGCGYKLTAEHIEGTHENDGKCTKCTVQYQIHKATTTVKEYVDITETTHTPVYTCSFEGCTSTWEGEPEAHTGGTHENKGECTLCKKVYQTHEQSETIKEYIKTQTGHTPVYKCTESTCEFTYEGTEVAHEGGTHENNGECTVEGCGYRYQIHEATDVVDHYGVLNPLYYGDKHLPYYTCSFEGCTSTWEGEPEAHEGGTHENDGKCTLCGVQYQTHGQSTEIAEYIQHETIHTETYKCTEPTCTKMYTGLSEKHTGATHDNGGKCTVCEYQYEVHEATEDVENYTIVAAQLGGGEEGYAGHIPNYKCSYEGCTSTWEGTKEAHIGGTHENNGICTVCEYTYQTHEATEIVDHYTIVAEQLGGGDEGYAGHIPNYKCTYEGCTSTWEGTKEAHTGGTHENDGICTVCEYQYQEHGISTEPAGYEKTPTGHTKLCKCTYEGCEGTHKVGEEETHTGATHDNGGKCTVCEYQYETHEQTTEISKYMIDDKVHLVLYKCSHPGCTSSYPGTAEDHKGGTHDNGGKCEVCKHAYQEHKASEEVVEYKTTETGHTPIYKCTYEGCEKTHIGEEEAHTGGTHENEGKCTVEGCGYRYQEHGKSDTVKEHQPTENGHKPIYGCICPGCTATYEGEEEAHTGATHENGGKCTECGKQYETHGKSDTVKEHEPTENGHKPIYGCVCPECTAIYEGEEEPHNVEEWTDNENGVHTGECVDCGEEVTEEHNYGEDGTCEDCEARVPAEDCEHAYGIQKNDTHHWKFCPKCETTEEGSLELHKYGEYTVNNDGTHSATCTVCEHKLTEEHDYGEDGTCEDCDTRIPAEECSHKYEMKHDETNHWKYCPKCETIEEGTKGEHTYGKYVDNGDGTHSRTCTVCEYTQTENHDENCDKCKESESTPGTGDNANGDNTTTGGDNTIADKEIPKAGMQSMVIGLIVSIGTLAIVTRFKMKKYKDI